MIYAIIAAGEGSRLSNEGFKGLKPMVEINGEMLIDRLIRIFINNAADAIIIIINENAQALAAHLKNISLPVPLHVLIKNTPSSLHSFHELLQLNKEKEDLCLTTTDTIFNEQEFKAYIQQFKNAPTNDGLLAVTSYVDDESPLYVDFNTENSVTAITDSTTSHKPFVSAGIYCLRKNALELVGLAINNGLHRMRNFQRSLLENDLNIKAFVFGKVVDVDHVADITKAEIFLKEIELNKNH